MQPRSIPTTTPHLDQVRQLRGEERKTELTTESASTESKVVITGDDVLIEYVKRLINCVKNLLESEIADAQRDSFEKFITHYVWSSRDKSGKKGRNPYWERL